MRFVLGTDIRVPCAVPHTLAAGNLLRISTYLLVGPKPPLFDTFQTTLDCSRHAPPSILQRIQYLLNFFLVIYRICHPSMYKTSSRQILSQNHDVSSIGGGKNISNTRESRKATDTWHGVQDARKRKQIQDRLAQRARRK